MLRLTIVKALSKSTMALLSISLLLAGCFHGEEKKGDDVVQQQTILVKVNEHIITEDNVDYVIEQTFTNNPLVSNNPDLRQKIIASLVASKAMKIVVEPSLSAAEIAAINLKTAHYQEELFVKAYLQQNAVPEPVTAAMIKEYYQNNLNKFGKAEVKTVEILQTKLKPTEKQRDEIINNHNTIIATDDWQAYAKSTYKILGLSYLKTKVSPGLLAEALEKSIKQLKQDETTNIIFVQARPAIVRVTKVESIPAKPLSAVRHEIRQKLAALQLKKAVKNSSTQVLKQVDVEYVGLEKSS